MAIPISQIFPKRAKTFFKVRFLQDFKKVMKGQEQDVYVDKLKEGKYQIYPQAKFGPVFFMIKTEEELKDLIEFL